VVSQSDFATKGETSYRFHEVLWARWHKHCGAHCPILDAAWGSFSWWGVQGQIFPFVVTGPAFTWFSYLPPPSINTWKDLEQKFHVHYFSGSTEKKLIDLATLRQRRNETPLEFLRRFREVKGMCFSLNLPYDQLADMAVAGMLPAIRGSCLAWSLTIWANCPRGCH
jgi:hypothetical protein